MSQLSFFEVEAPAPVTEMSVLASLRTSMPIAEDRWEPSLVDSVLLLNNRERSTTDDQVKTILVHAQDWVCLELEEWCHTILREW